MSDQATVHWARRLMRKPGSWTADNVFVPKPWHIQNPTPGFSGTYCGVNVVRFYGERADASIVSPPEGDVCRKCLRQRELGFVLPMGGGSSSRRG